MCNRLCQKCYNLYAILYPTRTVYTMYCAYTVYVVPARYCTRTVVYRTIMNTTCRVWCPVVPYMHRESHAVRPKNEMCELARTEPNKIKNEIE